MVSTLNFHQLWGSFILQEEADDNVNKYTVQTMVTKGQQQFSDGHSERPSARLEGVGPSGWYHLPDLRDERNGLVMAAPREWKG